MAPNGDDRDPESGQPPVETPEPPVIPPPRLFKVTTTVKQVQLDSAGLRPPTLEPRIDYISGHYFEHTSQGAVQIVSYVWVPQISQVMSRTQRAYAPGRWVEIEEVDFPTSQSTTAVN